MILSKFDRDFLESNKDLIADENWEDLFYKKRNSPVAIRLYDILKEAGIDIIKDYHICPYGCAAHCESLPSDLNVPEGVESIGNAAFWETKIERVHLSSTVEIIGRSAFNRCYDLVSINIPANVQRLEENAFSHCDSLKEVKFVKTSKLRLIDEGVFQHSGIEKITLPEGIETIGEGAFGECYYLTQVGLPKSLTTISYGAFSGSQFFKSIKYAGTKEQFQSIEFEEGWNTFQEETINVRCSDGNLKILAGEIVEK